jgi:hypothetical protein
MRSALRAATAVAVAGIVAVPAAVVPRSASALTPLTPAGCDAGRPAVAHHAGGDVLERQPADPPVPCVTSTGHAAAESHIVVTNRGQVIITPAVLPSGTLATGSGPDVGGGTDANAAPAGLAVTRDLGASWQVVRPLGLTWNPTDHADYVDPVTGRFFFEDYGPIPLAPSLGAQQDGPAHLLVSDDDGATWRHSVLSAVTLTENPHFTSAVAPAREPAPSGYPDVVYFCANTNVGFTSPVIAGRLCFKSLDGGTSWQQTSVLFTGLIPRHPECGPNGESYSAVDGYYPEPARDGSLYVLVACGGATYLARSSDEAATFPIVHTSSGPLRLPGDVPVDSITEAIGSGPQLRIDSSDTFYLVYPSLTGSTVTKLLLRVSGDHGRTWSGPLDVTAPKVSGVLRWAVAQRGDGHLVLAYLGHRDGQTTWDGYLTESRDASSGNPVLWSAQVNRPGDPMLFGDNIQGAGYVVGPAGLTLPYPFPLGIQPAAGLVAAGNDFMGAAIGSDGTGWGSFLQDCGPSPGAGRCPAQQDQTRAYAGRLAFTPAAPVGVFRGGRVTHDPGRPAAPGRSLAATGLPFVAPVLGLVLLAMGLLFSRPLERVRP